MALSKKSRQKSITSVASVGGMQKSLIDLISEKSNNSLRKSAWQINKMASL